MNVTTNPSFPTAVAVSGAGTSWSTPNNVKTNGAGSINGTFTANSNHFSQMISGTGITWLDNTGNPTTIPTNAVILGVTMTVVGQKNSGTSAEYANYNLVGVSAAQKSDLYGHSPWNVGGGVTTVTQGSGVDLWGCPTITPAQLNSPSFGWSFNYVATQAPGSGVNFTLFYVTLQVTYTIPVIPPVGPGSGASRSSAQIVNIWGSAGVAPGSFTLSASGAAGAVDLSWTASTGALYYNIYRGTSPGGESATPIATFVTGTTYNDTTVVSGTYYYTMKAINLSGNTNSNEASAAPATNVTIVQSSFGEYGGASKSVSLVSTPTPGNILVFVAAGQQNPNMTPPVGLTLIGSFTSVAVGGTQCVAYKRTVVGGDGTAWPWTFPGAGFSAFAMIGVWELSGASTFLFSGANGTNTVSTIISQSVTPASNAAVMAAMANYNGSNATNSSSPSPAFYTNLTPRTGGGIATWAKVDGSGGGAPSGSITLTNAYASADPAWAILMAS